MLKPPISSDLDVLRIAPGCGQDILSGIREGLGCRVVLDDSTYIGAKISECSVLLVVSVIFLAPSGRILSPAPITKYSSCLIDSSPWFMASYRQLSGFCIIIIFSLSNFLMKGVVVLLENFNIHWKELVSNGFMLSSVDVSELGSPVTHVSTPMLMVLVFVGMSVGRWFGGAGFLYLSI